MGPSGATKTLFTVFMGCVSAVAQSCNNATTTISNAADASSLAKCTTFTGVVAIATDSAEVVEINGLEEIQGSLIAANNSVLTTIGSNSLETVSDQITLANLSNLVNLTFPSWYSVGTLFVQNVTSPNVVNLETSVQQIDNLYILDTQLEDLQGFNVSSPQVQTLQITGNYYLVDAYFNVGNITTSAMIANNSGSTTVRLPSLTYAYELSIANASSVDLTMLQSVSQNLDISYSQTQNFSCPGLTFVGGDLTMGNNGELAGLNLNELVDVQGTLAIEDNPVLMDLSGLSSLSNIGSALEIRGAFTNLSLPSLQVVRGNASINTTGTGECSFISPSIVQGAVYACNGVIVHSNTMHGSNSTTDGTPAESSGVSGPAIAGIVVGIFVVFAIAAAGGFLWWRRKKSRRVSALPEFDNTQMVAYEKDEDFGRVWSGHNQPNHEMESPLVELGRAHSSRVHSGYEGRHELQAPSPFELESPATAMDKKG